MDERVFHYVRRNEQTRIPRRHIVIDTESRNVKTRGGREQTWRLGVAHFVKADKGRQVHEARREYLTAENMWRAVSDFCDKRARTILWAHNIGHDVRIADAFTILPALGWTLTAHNMAPRGTWLIWRRDGANLTFTDTGSIWPTTLAEIGKMFGMGKKPLPADDAPMAAWMARCHSDVDITLKAVSTYLEWLETNDMGNWQLTGAGQSYAAFRHKFLTHPMLVHADTDALAMERRAMWTGRCEAYWHGTILKQVVHEWDLTAAYATAAQELDLPIQLIGPLAGAGLRRGIDGQDGYAALAACTVETPVPVVPTSFEGRILWPVGRFETVLWDIEIREAIASGATVTAHHGYLYRTGPALRAWATWILDQLADRNGDIPAWQLKVFRHHSVALPGRFAMKYATWEEFGQMDSPAAERRTMVDDVEGRIYETMTVGNQLWRQDGEREWDQSQPAITGYITAAVRVRLWRLMNMLPPEATLYVDTDSLLVTDRWHDAVAALAGTREGRGLRLKRSWDGFSIYGPRQVVTGERVRMAGVPNSARRVARHEFEGEVWESLDFAMRSGRVDRVKVSGRVWKPTGVDRRRVGTRVGWTRPFHIGQEVECSGDSSGTEPP